LQNTTGKAVGVAVSEGNSPNVTSLTCLCGRHSGQQLKFPIPDPAVRKPLLIHRLRQKLVACVVNNLPSLISQQRWKPQAVALHPVRLLLARPM
jgi:hypothetical protein